MKLGFFHESRGRIRVNLTRWRSCFSDVSINWIMRNKVPSFPVSLIYSIKHYNLIEFYPLMIIFRVNNEWKLRNKI